jgi:uncharacterized protein YndB with AHSA1/START domain/DNA-binding transcriptional ArsR family regulator
MDKIFKALSDPSRREILDIVINRPGITVNEITEHFNFTRFAVMKHLKILEEIELIVPKKTGKFKKLYINVMPIQTVYDRWISKYSAIWAQNLSSLKLKLEGKETNMNDLNLKQVFVTYIKSSKEKVWQALTSAELTPQYYYNSVIQSDLKVGSKIEYIIKEESGIEKIAVAGELLEIEPFNKLCHSFRFPNSNDPLSRVTFTLEEQDNMVKLTVLHDQFENENDTFKSVSEGWPLILSGLKTYLETGKTMHK